MNKHYAAEHSATLPRTKATPLSLEGEYTVKDGYATGLAVSDDTCYLATSRGMELVNISAPHNMSRWSSKDFEQFSEVGYSIAVIDNNYIYLGSNLALHVFNITNKTRPKSINRYMLSGQLESMLAHNNRLFMTRGNYGFSIAQTASPTGLPIVAGHYSGGNEPFIKGMFIDNKVAYVTKHIENTLLILDIDNPYGVSLIQSLQIPESPEAAVSRLSAVTVLDGYAYMAGGQNGVVVADITEKGNAKVIANLLGKSRDLGIVDVAVYNDTLYAADAEFGVYVLDISNPYAPIPAEGYAVKGGASKLAISDGYLYCLNNQANNSKLLAYKITDDESLARVPAPNAKSPSEILKIVKKPSQ